jgi:hypothetical protein
MAALQQTKTAAASVTNAAAGKVKSFVDTDGMLKLKNESGTVTSLAPVAADPYSDTTDVPGQFGDITEGALGSVFTDGSGEARLYSWEVVAAYANRVSFPIDSWQAGDQIELTDSFGTNNATIEAGSEVPATLDLITATAGISDWINANFPYFTATNSGATLTLVHTTPGVHVTPSQADYYSAANIEGNTAYDLVGGRDAAPYPQRPYIGRIMDITGPPFGPICRMRMPNVLAFPLANVEGLTCSYGELMFSNDGGDAVVPLSYLETLAPVDTLTEQERQQLVLAYVGTCIKSANEGQDTLMIREAFSLQLLELIGN